MFDPGWWKTVQSWRWEAESAREPKKTFHQSLCSGEAEIYLWEVLLWGSGQRENRVGLRWGQRVHQWEGGCPTQFWGWLLGITAEEEDDVQSTERPPQSVCIWSPDPPGWDYNKGLVSDDVVAPALIYFFTGCLFTQKLYLYFNPGLKFGSKNSAPLVLPSPVRHSESCQIHIWSVLICTALMSEIQLQLCASLFCLNKYIYKSEVGPKQV